MNCAMRDRELGGLVGGPQCDDELPAKQSGSMKEGEAWVVKLTVCSAAVHLNTAASDLSECTLI